MLPEGQWARVRAAAREQKHINVSEIIVNEESLRSILNSMPIGIIFCDTGSMVRFINRTYAEYLCIEPEAALGRPITELIPDSRLPVVMKTGQAEMGDKCQIETSKGKRTLVVNRIPAVGSDGKIIGAISQSLFSDLQELKTVAKRVSMLEKKVDLCNLKIGSALSARYTLSDIKGQSAAITHAKELVRHYARSEAPVLIVGPTGIGKELFSHALHHESTRAEGAFVSINCAAIPPDLFESELFGYAPGAFTGARKEGKIGLIELAENGTLFLDEIGDMPLYAQVKLLRVLEEKVVYRVGDTAPHKVDFRLVVATNRHLKEMIREGNFREDLFYRFNTMTIVVPSLRERIEDIPILVRHVLERFGKQWVSFSNEAMTTLMRYDWPGNVRELKNVIESALSICGGNVIQVSDLPSEIVREVSGRGWLSLQAVGSAGERGRSSAGGPGRSLLRNRDSNEREQILRVLLENNWNMAKSAKILEIARATLYEKVKKHGLVRGQGLS